MIFCVSGRAKYGIIIFIIWFGVMCLSSLILFIALLSEKFNICLALIEVMLIAFTIILVIPLRNSVKKKTIIIDDGHLRLIIGGKEKNSIHLRDVTEVGTIALGGKTPRGGFYLKNGKKMVFECNWRDHMEKERLIQFFQNILKYRQQYNFKVIDKLHWMKTKI